MNIIFPFVGIFLNSVVIMSLLNLQLRSENMLLYDSRSRLIPTNLKTMFMIHKKISSSLKIMADDDDLFFLLAT